MFPPKKIAIVVVITLFPGTKRAAGLLSKAKKRQLKLRARPELFSRSILMETRGFSKLSFIGVVPMCSLCLSFVNFVITVFDHKEH